MTDTVTPHGFDYILVATTIPLLVVVAVLTWTRVRRFLRKGPSGPHAAPELSGVIASFAWVAVAVAFLIRPLAELEPGLTDVARVIGPGARVTAFIVAVVLLLQERDR